jgi:hypothetical protein
MAERRGGYRPTAPQNNPNIISPLGGNGQSGRNAGTFQGPKEMTGGAYGEASELRGLQQGALMAGERSRPMAPVTPLLAPTERPDEPLTAGMSFGPGPGPEVLNLPQLQQRSFSQIIADITRNDDTGDMNALLEYLTDRGL